MILFIYLLVLYVSLNVIDLVLTYYGLKNGAKELNPMLKKVSPLVMGIVKVAAVGLFIFLIVLAYKESILVANILLGVIDVFYIYVVINNIKVILKLK